MRKRTYVQRHWREFTLLCITISKMWTLLAARVCLQYTISHNMPHCMLITGWGLSMNLDLYVHCFDSLMGRVLHADLTTSMCIWTTAEPRVRLLQHKTGLRPPVIYYWSFTGDASVVVYFNCQCPPSVCLSLTYCSIYLGQPCDHLLGKNCPLGLPLVLFLF